MRSFLKMFNFSRKKSRKIEDSFREVCNNGKCKCFLNNKKINCKKAKKMFTKRHPEHRFSRLI